MDELLWLAQQIADADYSPLVSKFAKAALKHRPAIEAGMLLSQVAKGTIEGALRWHTALVADGTPRWECRWWTQDKYSPRFHSTDVFATALEALQALDEAKDG